MRARQPSLARLRQGFLLTALLMYAATLTLELPVIMLRLFLAYILALIVLAITGHPAIDAGSWGLVAFVPTVWSMLALAWPGGSGWWWRQQIGGRQPSEREQLAYHDALQLLKENSREALTEPGGWFVLDTPEPDAAVLGNTLMVSRGLMESPYLPAVLAHELGHLATPDATITAALNRLVVHPAIYDPEPQERHHQPPLDDELFFLIAIVVWAAKKLLAFLRGGLGLYILHPIWGHYWRRREYTADQYAAAARPGRRARGLPRNPRPHPRPPHPIHLAHRTHPPPNRATHRPAPHPCAPRPRRTPTTRRRHRTAMNTDKGARSRMTTRSTHGLFLGGMRVGVVLRTPVAAPATSPASIRNPPHPAPRRTPSAAKTSAGAAMPAVPAGIGRAAHGTTRVAPGAEPVKAAPSGPPAAGPDGPALTEPAPSAGGHSLRQAEACRSQATTDYLKGSPDMRTPPTLRTRPHTTTPAPASTARRWGQARRAAAELTPHAIEQVAQRVVQLLHERGAAEAQPTARLLDAAQLARHLGVTRTWVYEHATQLGAIRLGTGAKARLRFDLDTATTAIQNRHERPQRDSTPGGEAPRRGRPRRRTQPAVPLLPVHEPRSRGILARLVRIGRGR